MGEFLELAAQVWIVDGATLYPCYSARSGDGYAPFPDSPVILTAATPPLPRKENLTLRVQQGAEVQELVGAIDVVARNWDTKTFDFRRILPPWYATGLRLPE